jgi:hypothetical protein
MSFSWSVETLGPIPASSTHELHPSLGRLMIHTIFGAMLIPLLLAILYVSSPQLQGAPLFWLVLFDVILGLSVAIWNDSVLV